MRPIRRGWWFALAVTTLCASPAMAADKPVNISLFSPVALVKPEDGVTAFRFNLLYGKNTSVKVVDLGLRQLRGHCRGAARFG
jgi:hypothetical protein